MKRISIHNFNKIIQLQLKEIILFNNKIMGVFRNVGGNMNKYLITFLFYNKLKFSLPVNE